MKRLALVAVSVWLAMTPARAAERHAMTGLVLKVDAAARSVVVSCDEVPGYMAAMMMPFSVKDAAVLNGLRPGAAIDFTYVVDGQSSYIEGVRIKRYENLEQKPLELRRLKLLSDLAAGAPQKVLTVGEQVPEFSLIDQRQQPVRFSDLAGKVVGLTFTYIRCPNPAYCFRLANNFSQLQKRFEARMGRDLVLLTIAIDPELDRGGALAAYARDWTSRPEAWRFLTGSLPEVTRVAGQFGVGFWQDEGALTHSFRTAVIDRQGKVVASLEGNQFTARQLGDLVQSVLDR